MKRPVHHADATTDPAGDTPGQWLSDLADGRLDGHALERACRAWSEEAEARSTWHAYQVIGDVMRSDELAAGAGDDAAFLARLRGRLADEPVVVAPAARPASALPAPAARPTRTSAALQILAAGRSRWLRPMAAAAGFVAVAGVVVVLRQADPAAAGPAGAQWAAGGTVAVPVSTLGAGPVAQRPVAAADPLQGQMLRDAQIDAYLRAHRDAFAGSPPALPGGGVRTVEFDVPQR